MGRTILRAVVSSMRGEAGEVTASHAFDERYWKLYREERKKLVKAADPKCRKTFAVVLSPQQITHVARTARKRHETEAA